jgi:hypothetical protein
MSRCVGLGLFIVLPSGESDDLTARCLVDLTGRQLRRIVVGGSLPGKGPKAIIW